jgi:ABC-2 type transport system ATP-binding protein
MILEIKDVKKDYNGFHLQCSMQISEGVVTGLIGANGAGKSTLFKSILSLITIDGGTIKIFDKNIEDFTVQDKEQIGAVLAEGSFSTYLTVSKIIPVLQSFYHDFDKNNFLDQCKHFRIPMDKKLKDMSTGMKAKLNILIAMSHNARLLILDEPTAGLDVLSRNDLLDMMRAYMEPGNRSILVSSHISTDLEGLCDDLYLIHNGKLIMHEDTDTLLDTYGILKLNKEQFEKIGTKKMCYVQKETYGYHCLTKDRQFFMMNYPQVVIEKGNIDDILTIIERGEKI